MVSNSSPLLINESPLQVLPSLAVALGNVNEAIILQQIQYWLKNPKSGRVGKDGRKYIRDTYDEWHNQIPWLSVRSIKVRLKSLKDKGIVITENLNKSNFDRTQWYSIDYDKLNEFMQKDSEESSLYESEESSPSQSEGNSRSESEESSPTIPKTSTKISSETSTKKNKEVPVPPKGGTTQKDEPKDKKEEIPYTQIIDYLNKKTNQNLRATTKAYRRLIKARWNDGYKLEDFKTVIDNKSFEWQGTDFWRFMRPKTLFAANHFDDYLNENRRQSGNRADSGGYNVDKEAQEKFLSQIDEKDLPF